MLNRLPLLALSTVIAAGCVAESTSRLPSAPSPQSPELAALQPFVGNWHGTAEFVEPTPEEMQAMMKEMTPDYEGEMPTSFKGGSSSRWALGGHYLMTESWHEESPGVTVRYTEYISWRPDQGKYRTVYLADNGDYGEGWMTFDPATKTFQVTAEGLSGGSPSKGRGTMSFPDADTLTWTWEGESPMGRMVMRGTSYRL
jgi:hypothetical protein